jgi:pyruvate/2-oxoglutarate dehydrogenase complex dihydrolipoamide acyltransferase (E2) component
MPRLSESMIEGKLLMWLVEPGQEVSSGDQLAEIEADKANMEIEAPESGRIESLHGKPGDVIKVGELLVKMSSNPTATAPAHIETSSRAVEVSPETTQDAEASPLEKRLKQFKDREIGSK